MAKRDQRIDLRLTAIEAGFIKTQAKVAGKTVTDYLVGLVYGPTPYAPAHEQSGSEGKHDSPAVIDRSAPVSDRVAALKASMGLKTATELLDVSKLGGLVNTCEVDVGPVGTYEVRRPAKRPFSLRRCRCVWVAPGYDHVGVWLDFETQQYWPVIGTAAQTEDSFESQDEGARGA